MAHTTGVLTRVCDEHRAIFKVCLLLGAIAFTVDLALPQVRIFSLAIYAEPFLTILAVCTIFLFLCYLVRAPFRLVPGARLFPWLWRDFFYRVLSFERVAGFLIAVLYLWIIGTLLLNLKAAIPYLQPFSWDESFMRLDRALHAGRHPWQWLQVFATPGRTFALSFCYNLWGFIVPAFFFWQAWARPGMLRRQYFVSFGLCWIAIGLVAATLCSSAGPCYYARVTGQTVDPYAPLGRYLYQVRKSYPMWSLDIQEELWSYYAAHQPAGSAVGAIGQRPRRGRGEPLLAAEDSRRSGPWSGAPVAAPKFPPVENQLDPNQGDMIQKGISAMPSMHLSMCVLMVLAGWQAWRPLGVAFGLFSCVIELGAIHLGWHYAIDGYVSAFLTVVIWTAVGRMLRDSHVHAAEKAATATPRAGVAAGTMVAGDGT